MERLGHETSEIPVSRDDPGVAATSDKNTSIAEAANCSSSSAGSHGATLSTEGSTLDARIASLSKMSDADRCAELAQPVQVEQVQDIPMDTEYNYDTDEDLAGDDAVAATGAPADMPDLEGSDAEL